MLDFENLGELFAKIVHTEEWLELQKKFNGCNDIYVLGHGGNMAVADHAAIDITRLSNGARCRGINTFVIWVNESKPSSISP